MVGYIKFRHNFETAKQVEVKEYKNLPVEAANKDDSGTVVVSGRVERQYIYDWFIVDEHLFTITGVKYDYKAEETTVTVADALVSLDLCKRLKRSSAVFIDEFIDLINIATGTAPGSFNDPIFKLPYVTISYSDVYAITSLNTSRVNIESFGFYENIGEGGFYSICDLLLAMRDARRFSIIQNTTAPGDKLTTITRTHYINTVVTFGNDWVNIELVGAYYERRKKQQAFAKSVETTFKNVVAGSDANMISEEYNERPETTQTSAYYNGMRYNHASAVNPAYPNVIVSLYSEGETPIPETSTSATGTSYRKKYGAWDYKVCNSESEALGFSTFTAPTDSYKVVFTSSRIFRLADKLRMNVDGNIYEISVTNAITIDSGVDGYKYSCGDLRNLVSDRLNAKVVNGVLRL